MSTWSEAYQPLADITWNGSKVPYAKSRGYQTRVHVHKPGADIMRDRILFWLFALMDIPENDWLFFSGCDAIITRPELPLAPFLLENADFFAGLDHYVIHGDAWAMRACPATRDMIIAVLMHPRFCHGYSEQECLAEYLHCHNIDHFKEAIPDPTIIQAHIGPAWFARCEKLLNASPVRVKLFTPATKFSSDDMHIHPHGTVPLGLHWTPEFFMLHMGGKSLEYRIANIGGYVRKST